MVELVNSKIKFAKLIKELVLLLCSETWFKKNLDKFKGTTLSGLSVETEIYYSYRSKTTDLN